MDRTTFLAWGTAIYLPLLLVVFVLAGLPWTAWLAPATILLTSLAIYALRHTSPSSGGSRGRSALPGRPPRPARAPGR